jgi:hypothetical protein
MLICISHHSSGPLDLTKYMSYTLIWFLWTWKITWNYFNTVLDRFLLRFSSPSPLSNHFTFYYRKLLSAEWNTFLLYIASTIGITKKWMEILKLERIMSTISLYNYMLFSLENQEQQVKGIMIHINHWLLVVGLHRIRRWKNSHLLFVESIEPGMVLRMEIILKCRTLANLTNPSYANYKWLAIFL